MVLSAGVIAAWPRVLRARLALPRLRGAVLAARMAAPLRAPPVSRASAAEAHARCRAVARASRAVPGATCLVRATALVDWLREDGLDARLRIGVRRDGGPPRAHAWVEVDGAPLGEDAAALSAFAPLAEPPAAAAWTP
jgi:hypothetical protein